MGSSEKRPHGVRRLRDIDGERRASQVLVLSWSGVGVVMGVVAGSLLARLTGAGTVVSATVGGLTGGGLVYLVATVLPRILGIAGGSILWPSGRSTPRDSDHSLGDARRMRGEFDDAITAYREEAGARPNDPAPRLRAARLLRDETGDYDQAARWFRQALAVSSTVESRYAVLRELVEMAVLRWGEPRRVLADLARFAEEHDGTTAAAWARSEAASIKASVPAEEW